MSKIIQIEDKARAAILAEIDGERDYQNKKWGTDFDNKNTLNDWATYINLHLSKAATMGVKSDEQRRQFLKVASLAVAALEIFDKNNGFSPRHYDKT
jgi:hypothetical protein